MRNIEGYIMEAAGMPAAENVSPTEVHHMHDAVNEYVDVKTGIERDSSDELNALVKTLLKSIVDDPDGEDAHMFRVWMSDHAGDFNATFPRDDAYMHVIKKLYDEMI